MVATCTLSHAPENPQACLPLDWFFPLLMRRGGSVLPAIGFAVAACFLFAFLDTLSKYVVQTVPVLMALWVRYLVQAVLSSASLLPVHGRTILHTAQLRWQIVRGLFLVLSTILAILSVQRMPVGEFVAIIMLTPVLVTVLSATVFSERVSPAQWLCVVLGFAGALMIMQPGGQRFGWATLFPLGCTSAAVGYQMLSSHLGKSENPATVHFFSMWTGALVGTLLLPWGWSSDHSAAVWWLMVMMGACGALGHFLLVLAYQRASASVVVPYMYTQVGFAVLFGWLVFGDLPDHLAAAGIALVILSGVGNAWQLRRKALPAA